MTEKKSGPSDKPGDRKDPGHGHGHASGGSDRKKKKKKGGGYYKRS